uniref:Putative fucose-1-phosphate guanyltransferase n=1 Tax=Ixodes ricinus TaxID=34613 RepID=A0A6B0VDN4_IXORI
METSVCSFMRACLHSYDALRGKCPKKENAVFWDAVVISAADEQQAAAFRLQIQRKSEQGLLPLVPYHVFADLPGAKMGSGGATLHILERLAELYGAQSFAMRTLLIHTGGQSKRLPSHSVLGKLFALLPLSADTEFQMLDLKLAMYAPFLARMAPGVFLTCSDDIETYALPTASEGRWTFEGTGFTALAHPSPMSLGLTHGVYVLPENPAASSTCVTTSCLEVLQKPTEELMRKKGAIVTLTKEDGSCEEIAFTDSAFFFDSSVICRMLRFYEKAKPLSYEIDAYGDFLKALGTKTRDAGNVDTPDACGDTKPSIQDALRSSDLRVIVLPSSRFYHLGTTLEYIENLCTSKTFERELGTSRFLSSRLVGPTVEQNAPSRIEGVVMGSSLHSGCIIGPTVVIEHCRFETPVSVRKNCIVSNCRLAGDNKVQVDVPNDCIIFTACVTKSDASGYVTVAFGVRDDLKLVSKKRESLSYFGQKIGELARSSTLDLSLVFQEGSNASSLWEARLFAVKPTMSEAFLSTLHFVRRVLAGNRGDQSCQVAHVKVSMRDIVMWKDIPRIISHQDSIFD